MDRALIRRRDAAIAATVDHHDVKRLLAGLDSHVGDLAPVRRPGRILNIRLGAQQLPFAAAIRVTDEQRFAPFERLQKHHPLAVRR
jgi:hypothetical protein